MVSGYGDDNGVHHIVGIEINRHIVLVDVVVLVMALVGDITAVEVSHEVGINFLSVGKRLAHYGLVTAVLLFILCLRVCYVNEEEIVGLGVDSPETGP